MPPHSLSYCFMMCMNRIFAEEVCSVSPSFCGDWSDFRFQRLGGGCEKYTPLKTWDTKKKRKNEFGVKRFSMLIFRIEAVEVGRVSPFPYSVWSGFRV